MFNFLCKRLIIHNNSSSSSGISRSLQIHDHHLYFRRNLQSVLLPLFNFITTDTKTDNFTISYLVNALGFSRQTASSMSKYLNLKSHEKPDSVLALFEKNGVTKPQFKHFVKRYPKMLQCDPVKTLVPKIQFFQSKGISGADLGNLLTVTHTPFARSLENQIIPCFSYVCNLLQSHEQAVAAVRRYPYVLSRNIETQVEPYVSVLRDNGVSVSDILLFMRYWPGSRAVKLDKFKEDVESLKEMGFSPMKSQFVLGIIVLRSMNKGKWEKKVDVYRKWGFSEEEIMSSFVKSPWFLAASDDKINASMDFFVNEMGWSSSMIAKTPVLMTLSLKKRMIPRAAVFRFLTLKGVIKEKHMKCTTIMLWTEKLFFKRFLNSYDEIAPELLKIYNGKLSSLGCG